VVGLEALFDFVVVAGRRLVGDGKLDLVDCCCCCVNLVGDVCCVVDVGGGRRAPAA